jgi:hypothetical protein
VVTLLPAFYEMAGAAASLAMVHLQAAAFFKQSK